MRRILRVSAHTGAIRDVAAAEQAKDKDKQFVSTPSLPQFASMANSVFIRVVDPPPLQSGSQQQLSIIRLRFFWTSAYLCPLADINNEHGVTWLQLFALYVLNGGCPETAYDVGSFGRRPRLAFLSKQFYSASKRCVSL